MVGHPWLLRAKPLSAPLELQLAPIPRMHKPAPTTRHGGAHGPQRGAEERAAIRRRIEPRHMQPGAVERWTRIDGYGTASVWASLLKVDDKPLRHGFHVVFCDATGKDPLPQSVPPLPDSENLLSKIDIKPSDIKDYDGSSDHPRPTIGTPVEEILDRVTRTPLPGGHTLDSKNFHVLVLELPINEGEWDSAYGVGIASVKEARYRAGRLALAASAAVAYENLGYGDAVCNLCNGSSQAVGTLCLLE